VGARYVETGHLVYFRENELSAMAFDPSSLQVHGPSVPLVEDVAPWGSAQFGVSRDGALVFIDNHRWTKTTAPVWVDQEGRQESSGLPPGVYSTLKISPDGTKVAAESIQDANADVWIFDLISGVSRRFTFDPATDGYPLWTPDGERVVFRSEQGGGGIFWKRSDGAGEAVRVTPPNLFTFPHSVTPDGTRVPLNISDPSRSYDIATVTLDDRHVVEPLLETPHGERRPSLSPNGRWLAYQSDETGEDNIFVSPFPDVNGGRWQISIGGGTTPIWAPDGRAVFYATERAIMRVDLRTEPTIAPSAPVLLFQGPYFLNVRAWDVAPDGERFLMLERGADVTPEVHVVLNWFAELNARVPVHR
jgi:serine/threonine-protein kinase